MILTAEEVVAAISYLIPGFIALKIFYVFAFRSKRSDLEWAVWSLLGSAAIAPVTSGTASFLGLTKSPGTFEAAVKSCVTPIIAGPETERVAGVVACANSALAKQTDLFWLVLIGSIFGVVLGVILVALWRALDRRLPGVGAKGIATSWDRLFNNLPSAPWVEVLLGDGRRLQGILAKIASDIESEHPDLYLVAPAWLKQDGTREPIADVQGVWLPRSEVKSMVIVGPSIPG